MAKKITQCDSNRYIYGVLRLQPVHVNNRCLAEYQKDRQVTVRQDQVRQKGKRVRYVIERMTMSDVPRVIEIERLAYPSTWPPSAYRKELQDNRWAHYIVVPAIALARSSLRHCSNPGLGLNHRLLRFMADGG